MKLLIGLFWLELIARIAGPKDHGPYLLSLKWDEPMTDFDRVLYPALFPDVQED